MTVVTRFAPSPTGKLHVGNLRAALLNWLLARKTGGDFILRIDDTDRERSREEYVDAIKRDLEWLGLGWDRFERQSLRLARYEAAAEKLRADGRLYACFETPTELELKRKKLLNMGRPPIYDRSALTLTDAQKETYRAEGRRPHWRFKLEPERVAWSDGVRGETAVDCASVSDPVLIRADGGFLYSLCSVCDDIDMAVTDVVRGEDHVTNTATQIQMFKALGDAPNRFAHTALLVAADGSALSKRLGSLAIEDLRAEGIEPMAMLSLLARLGSSDPIEPRRDLGALAEGFDLSRFGRAPARFDPAELRLLNGKILHETPFEAVADRLTEMDAADPALWETVRENIETLADMTHWRAVIAGEHAPIIPGDDAEFVAHALAAAPPRPWDATTWKTWTDALKAETGRKGKRLFLPLRRALTGRDHGPDMAALLPLIQRTPHLN